MLWLICCSASGIDAQISIGEEHLVIRSSKSGSTFGEFPHTDWSLVRAVQCVDAENQREVLGRFLQEYMPALRAHLRYRRYYRNDEDNEDLLSDFVTDKLIAQELLTKVRQEVGLLRTFLKKCLDNFACSRLGKRQPLGLGREPNEVSLGQIDLDAAATCESACPFDLEWAKNVVTRAITLTHQDCMGLDPESSGLAQPHIWAVFEARLVVPITGEGQAPVSYEQLVIDLGADHVKAGPELVGNRAAEVSETDHACNS